METTFEDYYALVESGEGNDKSTPYWKDISMQAVGDPTQYG